MCLLWLHPGDKIGVACGSFRQEHFNWFRIKFLTGRYSIIDRLPHPAVFRCK